ncbi:MAG: hypothetical protein H6R27_1573 [Proteobacteria bacterium]|nr:hypothetical protein [Pseudomonadota bacterium]
MSDPKTGPGPEGETEETFVSRWSRLKARARETTAPVAETGAPPPQAADDTALPTPVGDDSARPPPELPDIDLLGEDSDYSAFLAEGIDTALRRRALRKLFHSPKFNVLDGLDDYMGDYTQFEPLGSIVTADMRHHIERVARLAERALEEGTGKEPRTEDVVAAPQEPEPTEEPPAEHDEPDRPA